MIQSWDVWQPKKMTIQPYLLAIIPDR